MLVSKTHDVAWFHFKWFFWCSKCICHSIIDFKCKLPSHVGQLPNVTCWTRSSITSSINCVSLNPTKQNKVDVLTKIRIIVGIILVPSNYLFSSQPNSIELCNKNVLSEGIVILIPSLMDFMPKMVGISFKSLFHTIMT